MSLSFLKNRWMWAASFLSVGVALPLAEHHHYWWAWTSMLAALICADVVGQKRERAKHVDALAKEGL